MLLHSVAVMANKAYEHGIGINIIFKVTICMYILFVGLMELLVLHNYYNHILNYKLEWMLIWLQKKHGDAPP